MQDRCTPLCAAEYELRKIEHLVQSREQRKVSGGAAAGSSKAADAANTAATIKSAAAQLSALYETTAKDPSGDAKETLNVISESNTNQNKDIIVKKDKQSVDSKDDPILASKDVSSKSSNAITTAIPVMASEPVPISNVKLTKSPQDGASVRADIVEVVKSECQPIQNKSNTPLQLSTTDRLENLLPNNLQLSNNIVEIKSNNNLAKECVTNIPIICGSSAVQTDNLVCVKSSPNSMAIVKSAVAPDTDTVVKADSEIVDNCDKKEALITTSSNKKKEDVKE